MNLNHLTDDALIIQTKKLVHEEREILVSILHHLREIERRRLFSKYRCSSLFAYAVTELKYSESQADRRISAMRLLRDLSQSASQDSLQGQADVAQILEEKIASGTLSLTNLVLAQTLFSKEKKAGRSMSLEVKESVLAKLEHQSTRQAEKIVCEISPEMKSRKRELTFHEIEDDQLQEKLLRLKGHYAHKYPNMSLSDLLHQLCDEKLESMERQKGGKLSPSAPRVDGISQAEVRRQVWRRDQGKCSHCQSTWAVEIDHKQPRAKGGASTIENLRLLCQKCNQRAAMEQFGLDKMVRYLERKV